MARRTVKIKIPIAKPDTFSKLLKSIIKRHEALGKESPLNGFVKVDMKTFGPRTTKADAHRAKSEALKDTSEAEMELAKNVYGTAEGQTAETPGTLYNDVEAILHLFRGSTYKGTEEAISEWGFNVVIGSAKSPKRKPK